jgi:hypothetical protein
MTTKVAEKMLPNFVAAVVPQIVAQQRENNN